MRGIFPILLTAAMAVLVMACGGSASPEGESASGSAANAGNAPQLQITPGQPRADAGETGERVRPPSELDITIDNCTWEPVEAGGPVELNLTFSITNNAPESLFATYRVQDGKGNIFRPKGFDSSITIYTKESDSRTLNTDKFEAGSTDLELVIAGQRRTTDIIPLENCTQP